MVDSSRNITPAPHRIDDAPIPEQAQADYFETVLRAAKQAVEATQEFTVDLDLVETRCRLIFAGRSVAEPFLDALAHLVISSEGQADAVMYVWDSQSSGVPMPPPIVPQHCFSNRGDIWRMDSARYRSAFHWVESSVNLFDRDRRTGVYWVPGTALLPFWAKASPFRTLFHWWLESTGAQLIHGAAFGTAKGALLLTGKGGVGKSTTALTALAHGLRYVSDDYLAIRLDPEPRVYSLYSTAKLDGPQMERFPALARLVANRGFHQSEKAVVQLHPAYSGQVARSMPLRLLATPEFGGVEQTVFKSVSALVLQRAASFTTMSQLPHAGSYLHDFMQRLVARVPGFALSLGTDLERIPGVISAMLDHSDDAIKIAAGPVQASAHGSLVSVIIPVYNGAHFLRDAVECVLSQGYENIEIIVVDDGSTDDLSSAVAALPIEVRLLRQENAGPAEARNRGIRDAGGEYIAFLDVDDLWPPGNLIRLKEHLDQHTAVDVVHGRGRLMRQAESGEFVFTGDPSEAFSYYIGAGLYRRTAFSKVGLYNPALRFGEDSDWFMRAAELKLAIEKLDEVCLYLRRHGGNMTLGKSMIELNSLRVMKLALDRKRALGSSTGQPGSRPVEPDDR